MNIPFFLPGIICIVAALIVMFRLMHYARFYAPSYFFWIGCILMGVGIVSLIHPLEFLFVFNRIIAGGVIAGGALISLISLLWRVRIKSSTANLKIDMLLRDSAFDEFHEVRVNASREKVKQVLQTTGVNDIPIAHLLMKIRGIADDDVDMSDRASNNDAVPGTFSTPDFDFFEVSPDELVTLMILKASVLKSDRKLPAPPKIRSLDEFMAFENPGYVKVAVNFRLIRVNDNETLLTTETRVQGIVPRDNRVFAHYWRIIYPGSAIIRRVWLDTLKRKAERQ
ncbi:MAG: hypothetical protein WCR04_03970 [Fibrobacteraceae bacterium]